MSECALDRLLRDGFRLVVEGSGASLTTPSGVQVLGMMAATNAPWAVADLVRGVEDWVRDCGLASIVAAAERGGLADAGE